jgi:hypothetical protein
MFQVDWSDDAIANDLCQLYLDHRAQSKEITYACNRIENLLRTSARALGTEISAEGLRKYRYEPLEVIFSLDGNDAEIQTVRWVGFSAP